MSKNASLLDHLKEFNLGTNKEPHPIYASSSLTPKEEEQHFKLLSDVFPKLVPEIEKEVNKLIKTGFIHEVKYPTWIANIMPIRRKYEQLHIYVDF